MLKMCSKIEIIGKENWLLKEVHLCTIVEDVKKLTTVCQLKIPRRVKWEGYLEQSKQLPIKRGDKIKVWLGYSSDSDLKLRFEGFIQSVATDVPVTINCEDGMFLLKQKTIEPKAFRNVKLSDLTGYLLKDTAFDFELLEDISLGYYRVTAKTIAQELQKLKEKHLLTAYFRNGKLYIGLTYPTTNRKKHRVAYGINLIEENLEYRKKEAIRVRVQATTFNKKHKKTTIELGDKEGDLIKIRIDGLTQAELQKYAQQALDNYKKSGLKGSLTTFGVPEISKVDIVKIETKDGNQGAYLIKKNEINFSIDGYRQKIELGQILDNE